MEIRKEDNIKVGQFLVQNGIISEESLNEALLMQKDNQDRLIGEILVTQGVLSKEDLIMALEMYLMVTNYDINFVDEWLDQEEIDILIDKVRP